VSPHELLETLRRSGVEIATDGERLRVSAPRGVVTEEIRRTLVAHKPELLAELAGETVWPPECLDTERRFRVPYARLFPLLGGPVTTPAGPGTLLQVFADRAAVRLDADPDRLTFVLPVEVRPAGAAVAGDLPTLATRVH